MLDGSELTRPSRSQSPMSPSPSFSDSESRLSPPSESQETLGPSTSRAGSPSEPRQQVPLPIEEVEEDSVTCLWEECGIVFTHLPTLIDHIHNGESLGNFQFSLCFSKHRDLGIVEWKSWWLSGAFTWRSLLGGGSDGKGSSCLISLGEMLARGVGKKSTKERISILGSILMISWPS